ncbi:DUF5689 domain-containing protein [Muriicola sp. Z0-33]|uniref:DUF5689 domain-containing protein n=1 Tax=Muriicola sp. Z0-33 TaxID=2816957 RepID=UPI0022371FC7|nr:DUF5689 domain-containing protein [Muriicola sp. Z0-33]MCW5514921.1 lamin tail domain-containing protein [Muriicola sp. Z0-33]
MDKCLITVIKICIGIALLVLYSGCVQEREFKEPDKGCSDVLSANISLIELKLLYEDITIQIQEDLVIEGYVISSDRAGNIFGSLHIQDNPDFPTEGIQIQVDLTDSHLFYKAGAKILIKLKGLYLGKSKSIYKIGGVLNVFGAETVGRLPANKAQEHIFLSCEKAGDLRPLQVAINDLDDRMLNTLVSLEHLELIEEEQDSIYAINAKETERNLTDCEDNILQLLNSGFSDFQHVKMPSGNGSITGVLHKKNRNYQLIIRDTLDINFTGERCKSTLNEVSTEKVFITEIADPDNNSKARFVELYNTESNEISLDGWLLRRYTNDNTTVGSIIELAGYVIPAESTLVISPNPEEFELVYKKSPDVGAGTNSPADSNGDDNLELVDPFGVVIDVFGIVGEDGSGTNHEFEDGRAIRKPEIVKGNPIFNFEEWTIYNDTGAMGTIKLPQNAPEDFSPGIR